MQGPDANTHRTFGRARAGRTFWGLCLWAIVLAATGAPAGSATADPPNDDDAVQRGRYLARAANCQSCHTREGGAPYAGGVAFDTPFGTLYSTNITPDTTTGLGDWSQGDFLRALHEGIGDEGEQLYPAFPYTSYTDMSRADIAALWTYLKTVPAVTYRPPDNALIFPFNHRALIHGWKWLHFSPGDLDTPAPPQDRSVARGRYLTQTLGHCGQCHTPRGLTYALDDDKRLSGAKLDGWYAPNITGHADGIGAWSDAALDTYLATGHVRQPSAASVAAGPMAEVITQSTRYLSADDRAAMIAYLREVPARADTPPDTAPADAAPASAAATALYERHCASCHAAGAPDGPAEAFSRYATVTNNDPSNLIRVMLFGVSRRGADGAVFMPGYASRLDDEQIAELVNVLRSRVGASLVSAADVAAARPE